MIRVYVGTADLDNNTLGLGGPGGYGCSGSASFCNNAVSRGQGNVSGASADDFALWGGSISFDTQTNWHFGLTTAGLDSSEYDFYSVAVHELAHVLGFGTSPSFDRLASGTFTGSNATSVYGGAVPLYSDESHWNEGTLSQFEGAPQETAMDPSIFNGTRKNFTELDYAAMQDIGWAVTPVPETDTWTMLLAGLGLVSFATRRRMA